jgi:hypothetical protein
VFTDAERFALAGSLAGAVPGPCRFSGRRAGIETFARELETHGRPGSPRPGTQPKRSPDTAGGSDRDPPICAAALMISDLEKDAQMDRS